MYNLSKMRFLRPLEPIDLIDGMPAESLESFRQRRIDAYATQFDRQVKTASTRGRKRPVYRIDPAAPDDRSRWVWYPSVSAAFRAIKKGGPRENSKPDVICQAIRHGWQCDGWIWDYAENKAGRLAMGEHAKWDDKTWDSYLADLRRMASDESYQPDRDTFRAMVERLAWKVREERRRAKCALLRD